MPPKSYSKLIVPGINLNKVCGMIRLIFSYLKPYVAFEQMEKVKLININLIAHSTFTWLEMKFKRAKGNLKKQILN